MSYMKQASNLPLSDDFLTEYAATVDKFLTTQNYMETLIHDMPSLTAGGALVVAMVETVELRADAVIAYKRSKSNV